MVLNSCSSSHSLTFLHMCFGSLLLRPQLDVGGKVSDYYTPWTFTYEIPLGSPFGWKDTDGGTD